MNCNVIKPHLGVRSIVMCLYVYMSVCSHISTRSSATAEGLCDAICW